MRIDYHLKDKFDFGLILPVVVLFCFGLAAIYSSTINNPLAQGNFQKQLIWGTFALIIFFITYFLPTKSFKALAVPSYLISVLLLIFVLLVGKQISGSRSWITFGSLGFQPSELAKISTILALAYFLSRNNTDIDSLKDILITLSIGFVPVLLLQVHKDPAGHPVKCPGAA